MNQTSRAGDRGDSAHGEPDVFERRRTARRCLQDDTDGGVDAANKRLRFQTAFRRIERPVSEHCAAGFAGLPLAGSAHLSPGARQRQGADGRLPTRERHAI